MRLVRLPRCGPLIWAVVLLSFILVLSLASHRNRRDPKIRQRDAGLHLWKPRAPGFRPFAAWRRAVTSVPSGPSGPPPPPPPPSPQLSSLALLLYVSSCRDSPESDARALRLLSWSIRQWSAHSRRVLPHATLVLALPRALWQASTARLDTEERRACAITSVNATLTAPVNGTALTSVLLHFPSAGCPAAVDALIFVDEAGFKPLSMETERASARHPWVGDGCYRMWRDRILSIALLQRLARIGSGNAATLPPSTPQFSVVVSVDSDTFVCPEASSIAHLQTQLASIGAGEKDSASILAPAPLGNGVVPYLPTTAVERNCGVLAFGSHATSILLTDAWLHALHKQLLCAACRLKGDQSAFREAVHLHYAGERSGREQVVSVERWCRTQGSCSSGCVLIHRHDRVSGYLGTNDTAATEMWR